MKKIFLLLTLAILVCACGNEYNEEPVERYVRDFPVYKNMWKWDDYEGYYYCEFQIPELTNYVFNNGIISVYYLTVINKKEVMYPLPYDFYGMDSSGYRWTEQSTCEIRPGYITFVTKSNNYDAGLFPPELTFTVKMMW